MDQAHDGAKCFHENQHIMKMLICYLPILVGHCLIANWAKLEKSSFSQKLFFLVIQVGRSRGVRGERTEHTQLFSRTLAGFGLTWHQKDHFSTFDGKLELQCTRNASQNLPYCPGSFQDTFIIYSSISHQRNFLKYVVKRTNHENTKSGNLKI